MLLKRTKEQARSQSRTALSGGEDRVDDPSLTNSGEGVMVDVSAKFGVSQTDEYSREAYLGLWLQLPPALSSLTDQATAY